MTNVRWRNFARLPVAPLSRNCGAGRCGQGAESSRCRLADVCPRPSGHQVLGAHAGQRGQRLEVDARFERPSGGRGARGAGAPPAGEEGAAPADGRGRGPAAPQILSNPEVTPIVVNGVMYLDAGGDHILALDAATGKEIWRFQIPNGDTT